MGLLCKLTAYLVELCNHKIHQSNANQDYHHHELQHNRIHSYHDFPLQMIEILKLLDNPLVRLYAICILYLVNTPADSLVIQVDFHFLMLNHHHKQLFIRRIYLKKIKRFEICMCHMMWCWFTFVASSKTT